MSDLYPGLPDQLYTVSATILGPGGAGPLDLQRMSIGKQARNWRFQGPMIPSSERFLRLSDGDVAVIDFGGVDSPTRVEALLLSAAAPNDASLYDHVVGHLNTRSMRILAGDQWEDMLLSAVPADDHSAWDLGLEPVVRRVPSEPVAAPIAVAGTVRTRGSANRRRQTPEELELALILQREIGEKGERAIFEHYRRLHGADHVEWVSRTDAVHPFDIALLSGENGPDIKVEVKSTSAGFHAPFHISRSELREAAQSPHYRLSRVFDIRRHRAEVREVHHGLDAWAQGLIARVEQFERQGDLIVSQLRVYPAGMNVAWTGAFRVDVS